MEGEEILTEKDIEEFKQFRKQLRALEKKIADTYGYNYSPQLLEFFTSINKLIKIINTVIKRRKITETEKNEIAELTESVQEIISYISRVNPFFFF